MWYWNTVDCNEALPGIHDLTHCIPMEDDTHPFKADITPEGKVWGSDKNGYPLLMDIPGPRQSDLIEMAEQVRTARINTALENISLLQTKLQMSVITENEKTVLIAWLQYIDDVKAVDVSVAPDIEWPPSPE